MIPPDPIRTGSSSGERSLRRRRRLQELGLPSNNFIKPFSPFSLTLLQKARVLVFMFTQGILNGEVSLYHWPPVWFGISCMTTDIFLNCKTDQSKTIKREVNGTVILPHLVFPGLLLEWSKIWCPPLNGVGTLATKWGSGWRRNLPPSQWLVLKNGKKWKYTVFYQVVCIQV